MSSVFGAISYMSMTWYLTVTANLWYSTSVKVGLYTPQSCFTRYFTTILSTVTTVMVICVGIMWQLLGLNLLAGVLIFLLSFVGFNFGVRALLQGELSLCDLLSQRWRSSICFHSHVSVNDTTATLETEQGYFCSAWTSCCYRRDKSDRVAPDIELAVSGPSATITPLSPPPVSLVAKMGYVSNPLTQALSQGSDADSMTVRQSFHRNSPAQPEGSQQNPASGPSLDNSSNTAGILHKGLRRNGSSKSRGMSLSLSEQLLEEVSYLYPIDPLTVQ